MLAVAYALRLGRELGAEVFLGICQSNQVSHTGADGITRTLGQPTFLGQIVPGRRVVIVDDVATFGSTLANLRGWIEHQGAHVIQATTLGATFVVSLSIAVLRLWRASWVPFTACAPAGEAVAADTTQARTTEPDTPILLVLGFGRLTLMRSS